MTEEQTAELIEILKHVVTSDILSTVAVGIFLIMTVLEIIYFYWKYQKVKKMLEEYYKTLTDDQKEKIKYYKEIKKL